MSFELIVPADTLRFVAFVAGSFAAVLLFCSLLDPDLFLHFEVTPHRTVLFYLGIFTVVLTVSRSMVPEERFVFDPEQAMLDVVRFTHYLPNEWKGNLHSQKVGTMYRFPTNPPRSTSSLANCSSSRS